MKTKLKEGDIVRHVISGEKMVVYRLYDRPEAHVETRAYSNGKYQTYYFQRCELEVIE